jgi:hypothetical protein
MKAAVTSFLVALALLTTTAACGRRAHRTDTIVVGRASLPLIIGGSSSNYGAARLDTGFLPDPFRVAVVSGAAYASGNVVELGRLGLSPRNGGACRGYSTAQPDVIIQVARPGRFLRFFVNAPGDTTLVINDGAGQWWCSDDDGGRLNPMIDMPMPVAGQYDIWVGSYQAGANIQSVLSVTELPQVGP